MQEAREATDFELEEDTLWQGRIKLWQPKRGFGYRFNLDPVLLAGFVRSDSSKRILDLGAGCGVVGLVLAAMGKAKDVSMIEIQPIMVEAARRNLKANGVEGCVIEKDLRVLKDVLQGEKFDRVVLNPPYIPSGQGRAGFDLGRDMGRHERNGGIDDFLFYAAQHVTPEGSINVILPFGRRQALHHAFEKIGFTVVREQEVHAREDSAAKHVICEGMRKVQGKEQKLEASKLILHQGAEQDFTLEVQKMLGMV
jgi:tRNA1Val (adenine37-N6)-methyltransferase